MNLVTHSDPNISPGRNTLICAGEIDMPVTEQFSEALKPLLEPGLTGDVAVDLSQIGFIDSQGLSVLMKAAKVLQPQSRRLHIYTRAGGQVETVLKLGRFERIMDLQALA